MASQQLSPDFAAGAVSLQHAPPFASAFSLQQLPAGVAAWALLELGDEEQAARRNIPR